jgi:hypothetical protein
MRGNVLLNVLRPSAVAAALFAAAAAGSTAVAQTSVVLNGRVVDSAGVGRRAKVVVRESESGSSSQGMHAIGIMPAELGHAETDSDGRFQIALTALPARVAVDVTIGAVTAGHVEVDSSAVRGSRNYPILVHARSAQTLATVNVKARYQKRPSQFDYLRGEPSTRTETVSPSSTEWFDPLSAGSVGAVLRASPDMMVGADGSASLLGAASGSNQLEVGGMRVPGSMLSGLNGATLSFSPWDVTSGGAAGATVNLMTYPSSQYHKTSVSVRTGAGGVPGWTNSGGPSDGLDVPVQVSVSSAAPIGKVSYSVTGFFQRDETQLPRWDRAIGPMQRDVLDSLSGLLGTPTVAAQDRSTEGGFIARTDLTPNRSDRTLALTVGLTRSSQFGGLRGGSRTASLGVNSVQDVGLLELQSSQVVRDRVMVESQFSAAIAAGNTVREADGPTLFVTDANGGNIIVTGAASPQPSNRVVSGEAVMRGTWYSRDNATRFVAQIQARGEHANLGGTGPHSTFVVGSAEALAAGDAISLTRESGYASERASSLVLGPSLSARHDLRKNGSLLLGVRADAWVANGVLANATMRHVDLSPRASWLERLGHRAGNRGSVATLRAGVGRFVDWPEVQQWADAWAGTGASRELCSGNGVPRFTVADEAQRCMSADASESVGRTIATSGLLPGASNRADVSLSFDEVAPGVTASIGAGVAQNDRIAARLSPLVNAPVLDRLAGDGGRALLVNQSEISNDGVVGVAAIPAGVPDVTRLVSSARSTAFQWRVRLASSLPMAPVTWNVTYTHTAGRERSLAIASPSSATSFVRGPLSAGGDHAMGLSLGTWIGLATVRVAALARSGVRFTPLADRDLNGDGRANDAAFVPASESQAWAAAVPRNMRGCVLKSAGRIAGFNSCSGPWSVTSYMSASLPGAILGMPGGSQVSLAVSNPLAVFGHQKGITFGSSVPVNAVLEDVRGFDASAQGFRGEPLAGFGRPFALEGSISDPMRIAVAVQFPLGRNVISQRLARTVEGLRHDTTTAGRAAAAAELLSDLPPVPLLMLQSGISGELQLTAPQRKELQALGARWQATAISLVLRAYGDGRQSGADGSVQQRLLNARTEFFRKILDFNAEVAGILTPDQFALLPAYTQQLLSPRMWRYMALMDAGEI